jgi:hypothetical protein
LNSSGNINLDLGLDPVTAHEFHDETLPGAKITAEKGALKKAVEDKSQEFVEKARRFTRRHNTNRAFH